MCGDHGEGLVGDVEVPDELPKHSAKKTPVVLSHMPLRDLFRYGSWVPLLPMLPPRFPLKCLAPNQPQVKRNPFEVLQGLMVR